MTTGRQAVWCGIARRGLPALLLSLAACGSADESSAAPAADAAPGRQAAPADASADASVTTDAPEAPVVPGRADPQEPEGEAPLAHLLRDGRELPLDEAAARALGRDALALFAACADREKRLVGPDDWLSAQRSGLCLRLAFEPPRTLVTAASGEVSVSELLVPFGTARFAAQIIVRDGDTLFSPFIADAAAWNALRVAAGAR